MDKSYHPSIAHVLQFFVHDQNTVAEDFQALAYQIADRNPYSAETTVALRKLLEAKDAAIRASFDHK